MTESGQTDGETDERSVDDLLATLADHQRQLDDLARAVAAQQRMLDAHEQTLHPQRTQR